MKRTRTIHLMLLENAEYDQVVHAVLFADEDCPMLLQRDHFFGSDELLGLIEKWHQYAHASSVGFEADESLLSFLADLQEIERDYMMEQGSPAPSKTSKINLAQGETF